MLVVIELTPNSSLSFVNPFRNRVGVEDRSHHIEAACYNREEWIKRTGGLDLRLLIDTIQFALPNPIIQYLLDSSGSGPW